MFDAIVLIAWIVGIALGIMWLFLPWILMARIDEVIEELRKLNHGITKQQGGGK